MVVSPQKDIMFVTEKDRMLKKLQKYCTSCESSQGHNAREFPEMGDMGLSPQKDRMPATFQRWATWV